jgi:hypothetical protein
MEGVLSREIILGHSDPIRPLSAVRSTLLQSSLATLRQRGHYARYLSLLDARDRETIVAELAPSWLPCDIAVKHYSAAPSWLASRRGFSCITWIASGLECFRAARSR